MKYLKEYSEEDLTDLASDLKSIGQSDWMGFYITYVVNGDDTVGTSAVAVVGDSWKSIAESIIVDFGIEDFEEADIDLGKLASVDDIMATIDDFWGSGMGSNWDSFEYKFWEMTPKKLENSIETANLLDTGDCLEMGRRYFSDFDSVVLKPRF
jgi:hypothetical protein